MTDAIRRYGISACFPAFNEAENLEALVAAADQVLRTVTENYELIIVDDGSTDRTKEVVKCLAPRYPQLQVIHHAQNHGYGAALVTGFKNCQKDLIFFSDADNQFDLHDLPKLLALIDRADVVVGYRAKRGDPSHRRLNALLWNALIRLLLKVKVRDLNCAFKLFRRSILEQIGLDQLTSTGAMINAELLAKLGKVHARIREVEVQHYPRRYGRQTGASPGVILKAFKELFKLYSQLR